MPALGVGSISTYFLQNRNRLLLEVNEIQHLITLSFVSAPKGKVLEPIKELSCFESVELQTPFGQTEYKFKFAKAIDLAIMATLLSQAYELLGFDCAIAIAGQQAERLEPQTVVDSLRLKEIPSVA